jgi:type I restriction enzyme R subunit
MLGRGTRLGDQYPDKTHFTVFDCFDGTLVEFFRNASTMAPEPPVTSTRTIEEITEAIWNNKDREYNVHCLVKRLHRINKEMSGEARGDFVAFGIHNGDVGEFAKTLESKLNGDFTNTMELLRKKEFQELLVNYKRRERTFIKAIEHQDIVSSTYLVRNGLGREHKPEDYLQLFARFVRENSVHIEAIRILLERPADWTTDALKELSQKLRTAPERFTIETLQKVHQLHYHKALIDIISMVKHAASAEHPLLTAEERANKAVAKISAGKSFAEEQQQWLNRIRDHLVANLSIDRTDFDTIPIFELAGGWRKANNVFDGKLIELIKTLNEALAI